MKQQSLDSREIWQVSQLTRSLKLSVQKTYDKIWVEGEVSNLAKPASGHMYFTIKDSAAQIRCVLFRSALARSKISPQQGDLVIVQASASVYEARGDLQLICERIEPAGDGLLQRKFEEIKKKLQQEGLFEEHHKLPFPPYPSTIAVISSSSGAAFQDFRKVIQRRFPLIQILLYDVLVQGAQAAEQVCRALDDIQQKRQADSIVIIRGGGSIEDLWAFNNETLAQRIYNMDIPIMTGIGHEIDFTIADFVSDQRAPTPSAAAEMISPDGASLQKTIRDHYQRLYRLINDQMRSQAQTVDWQFRQLKRLHPTVLLRNYRSRLQQHKKRLQQLNRLRIDQYSNRYHIAQTRLLGLSPNAQLLARQSAVKVIEDRLQRSMQQNLEDKRNRTHLAATTLHTVSPLQTMKRGYAIAISTHDGKIIRSYNQVKIGDALKVALQTGHLHANVIKTDAAPLIALSEEKNDKSR